MSMALCFCSAFYVLSWQFCVHSKFLIFHSNSKLIMLLLLLLLLLIFMHFIWGSFSKHIGRRKFLLSSGLGMALCTFIAANLMYFEHSTSKGGNTILLICVLGYVCCSSLGVLVIPWTLIGELLPTEVSLFSSYRCYKHSIYFHTA